ncbi:MAG: M1 family metallopeptidase [Nocardioidaceae bacterium]
MPLSRPARRPATRAALGITVAALVLPAGVVSAGAAQAGQPAPGGESVGDSLFPTIGNTGYHALHYDVRLGYFAAGKRIVAASTMTARATRPLSSFSLDLEGLTVSSAVVDGRAATFSRHDDKLVVTPRRPVSGRFTTVVRYAGTPVTHTDPDGASDGWVPTRDGATVVSEPVGAATWFPDNNTPRDKATFSMRITVPSTLAVAANGDLVSRRRHGARTTWRWEQTRPMATYLAMISIGRYHVYHSTMRTTSGRRLPVWSFVQAKYGSLAAQRRLIPRIVRFEERRFGRYPFTSVGIVVKDLGVGYALETQNRPVFDGVPDTSTLVHELAHQWYGDSVTPRSWEDIWLNEGFASYAEDLWAAAHGGPSTQAAFQERYDSHPAGDALWSPAPARFSDPADLFGAPVYVRGGMTLQALRARIGTPDFLAVLHRWAATERGRSTDTSAFIALAERVSGRHLGGLFHRWLYVAKKPVGY